MTMLISPAPYGLDGLEFGATRSPYAPGRPHRGKDWKWRWSDVTRSRRVHAPVSGRVTRVFKSGSWNQGWGDLVEITVLDAFGFVIESTLNHLETGTIQVSVGDYVEAGDYLGQMGATGDTSGNVHLHEELWINWVRVDPDKYRREHLPGTPTSAGGGAQPIDPEEDDMPLTDDDVKKVVAAVVKALPAAVAKSVWGFKLQGRTAGERLRNIATDVWGFVIGSKAQTHMEHGRAGDVVALGAARSGKAASRAASALDDIAALEPGQAPSAAMLDRLAADLKASLPEATARATAAELAKRLTS